MAFSDMDLNYNNTIDDEEIKEIKSSKFSCLKELKEPLNKKNWATWSKRMIGMLKACECYPYIDGTLMKPDLKDHPRSAHNWQANDDNCKLQI